MKNQTVRVVLLLLAVWAASFWVKKDSVEWMDATPASVHGEWTQVGPYVEDDRPYLIKISATDVSMTLWNNPRLQGNAEEKGRVIRARETDPGNVGMDNFQWQQAWAASPQQTFKSCHS